MKKKNLAGLSDFANNLGDIISASMGGNVVARNSSAVSDFDNKLLNYRRQIDERNRQYDVMRYQARLNDMQERIRRGEKIQDLLHRDSREAVADNRYNEGVKFRDKQAEESNRRWEISSDMQEKQFTQQQKNVDRAYGLQENRLATSSQNSLLNFIAKKNNSSNDKILLGADGITEYVVPKNKVDAVVGHAYSLLKKLVKDKEGEKDFNELTIENSKSGTMNCQAAVVNNMIQDYPEVEEYYKKAIGGVQTSEKEGQPTKKSLGF